MFRHKGISETQLLMTITVIIIIVIIISVLYANIGFQLFHLIKGFASIIHQNITKIRSADRTTHFVAYAQRHHMTAVTHLLTWRTVCVCRRCRQVYRRTRHTVKKKQREKKGNKGICQCPQIFFCYIFSFHILFINSSNNGNGKLGRRLCAYAFVCVFVCVRKGEEECPFRTY